MEEDPRIDDSGDEASDDVHNLADIRVVGIGGSAGALSALRTFFTSMPANSGMAFVVILHLAPTQKSSADSVIQQSTAMPVVQVTERVTVEANHVYVISPNKYLSMDNGSIDVRDLDGTHGRRAPIDVFFRTLAETHGRDAGAIVLSGSGADGAIGVQRIKERGGVVLVQDPDEAEFDSMPRNTIATDRKSVV